MPRLDIELVTRGLAPSRSAAQRLIADGAVFVAPQLCVTKPAYLVAADTPLWVQTSDETRFVSRAGAKLAHALAELQLDPQGQTVLDLGMSAGGFADCLLQAGAAAVIGIEVGHGQLHPRLQADPRVVCLERTHAREATLPGLRAYTPLTPGAGFAWAVADLSFISLTKVLPALAGMLAPAAQALLLIKPQFELHPGALDSRGVVTDPALHEQAIASVRQACEALAWQVRSCVRSAVCGTDGNQEFFLHIGTPPVRAAVPRSTP